MDQQFRWFVGLDWASALHRVCVLNDEGERVAERDVAHSGAALADMCAWLCQVTGAAPEEIAVAIETPRGPVVEALLEHGFAVFSINPKQLDRFRDRFSLAGAKTTAATLWCSAIRCAPIAMPFAASPLTIRW